MLPSAAALELFCGIGGFAAACDGLSGAGIGQITAVDIDRTALAVQALNFPQQRPIVAEPAGNSLRLPVVRWGLKRVGIR